MEPATVSVPKDLHRISTEWKGNMHFESVVNGHALHFDKTPAHGGEDTGPRPKPVFLSAVAGCSGMEIISILSKMHLSIDEFHIDVVGEVTDTQPKVYKSVHIIFSVKGRNMDKEKIEKAINLTMGKYCGVIEMVRRFAGVTSEVRFTT